MKLLSLICGIILFFLLPLQTENREAIAQEASLESASISGTVTLPTSSSSSSRQFRGAAYRNRGNSSASSQNSSDSNPYINTIVSAHPVSFSIDNLPTSDSVQIIQKNAVFIPQVTPVTIGSTVQFVNSDSFYHNVFSLTPGARFNIGRRKTGDVYSKEVPALEWKVSGLGPIDLFCDIHSQMNAIILSLDTPYFTRVNEDGTYTLNNLPEGTYELRGYNRNTELYTQRLSIDENEQHQLNLNLVN